MKIIIVTQKEPFFIPAVLEAIVPHYKKYLEAIAFQKPNEFKKPLKSFWYYLRFWGPVQLLKFGLVFLRKYQKLSRMDFLEGVNIIEDADVNSPEFIEMAREVDYLLSIAANQIFKDELLNAPREMCLNIHAALLPNYRGFNPSFWVLKNGEKETGVTIHKMTSELDRGPIVMQRKIEIAPDETWFSLQSKVATVASNMLIELLPGLVNKNISLQDMEGEGSLFKKPKVRDGKEFRKAGGKFI